jgi:hypothetical protein
MMLMVSVMLFLAARDPVRNVAILDTLIVGLCIRYCRSRCSILAASTRRI